MTEPEPVRKSQLPTTPPPEWEITTVGGKGSAVVRRRVTFGDWEPVLPDHWADEPDPGIRDAARQASGQQPECAPCNDTGACNGGPCAHPAAGLSGTQPANDEAHPPTTGFAVEIHGPDGWTQATSAFDTLPTARQQQSRVKKRHPGKPTRIVEETITRTIVEDEGR